MDVKTLSEWISELMLENERERKIDSVVHYKCSNKPIVVATVDVPKDEKVFSVDIVKFLESEGIKFDYLAYDGEKCRYCAMRYKKGFERCQQ